MLRHFAVLLHQSFCRRLFAAVFLQHSLLLVSRKVYKAVGVQAQNHSMAGALCVRFRSRHHTDIIQEFVPETGVQQVQCGMLHTAVIPVDRSPVLKRFFAGKSLVIVRVHIPQEVPGRASPLRHSIGFTFSRTAAARAGGIDPVSMPCKRAFAVLARLKVGDFRQTERQFTFRNRLPAAFFTLDHRDGFAPER